MKKSLVIGIAIVLGMAIYFAYQNHVARTSEQREALIALCDNTKVGSYNINAINDKFAHYYSEQLPDKENISQKLFGMSKSRFDTFCVVSYDSEGNITDSSVSYD